MDSTDLLIIIFSIFVIIGNTHLTYFLISCMGINKFDLILMNMKLRTLVPLIFKICIINMCIFTPIIEELIYRYAPQLIFHPSSYMCILISGPIFGLSHLYNYTRYKITLEHHKALKLSLLQSVQSCTIGLLFTLLQNYYGTIYPSILLHMLINTYAFYYQYEKYIK